MASDAKLRRGCYEGVLRSRLTGSAAGFEALAQSAGGCPVWRSRRSGPVEGRRRRRRRSGWAIRYAATLRTASALLTSIKVEVVISPLVSGSERGRHPSHDPPRAIRFAPGQPVLPGGPHHPSRRDRSSQRRTSGRGAGPGRAGRLSLARVEAQVAGGLAAAGALAKSAARAPAAILVSKPAICCKRYQNNVACTNPARAQAQAAVGAGP